MADFRITGPSATRLRVTQLEDRSVPAGANLLTPDIATATAGANAAVQILGASDNGLQVLFQSTATNVVQGQIDVPDTVDLFLLDRSNQSRVSLVSAFDFGLNDPNNGTKAIGVTPSTPGVLNNAVISSDGSAVAFLSAAPSQQFNSVNYDVNTDGGGEDLFVWNAAASRAGVQGTLDGKATQPVTLASISARGTGQKSALPNFIDGLAIGSTQTVSNPAISANGKTVSFLSDANPNRVVTGTNTGPYPTNYDNGNKVTTFFKESEGSLLYRSTNIGTFPEPVSILFYRADLNFTDMAATAQDYYKFYDDVQVDPLGRYMDAAGVSFVTTVRDTFRPTPRFSFSNQGQFLASNAPAADRDAYRFSFAGDGIGGITSPRVLSTTVNGFDFANGAFTGSGFEEAGKYQLGLRGLGSVENAFITRDRGDVIMTAISRPGIPNNDPTFFFFNSTNPNNPFTSNQPLPPASGALVDSYVNQNGDTAELYRVRVSGVGTGTILLSRDTSQPGNAGANGALDTSPNAVVASPDARRVTFVSKATNLAQNVSDTNDAFDVFQIDTSTSTTSAISVTAGNAFRTGNGPSSFPSATTDGLVVAYESDATNLVSVPDANGLTDVFVRDLVRQSTNVVSAPPGNPGTANGNSKRPIVTGTFNGGRVFFTSTATDLDPNATLVDPNGKLANPQQLYDANLPIIINASSRFLAIAGGTGGQVALATTTPDGNVTVAGKVFTPFPGFRGELRVASGDFNGDGVMDLVVGAGKGGGPRVQVIDGRTGRIMDDFFAFESSFTGGVYVSAGDFNNDGRDDIVVGAGELGGPRVQVYDSRTRRKLTDLFAFEPNSRVGVHVSAGDFNGDGRADLIVSAGTGGGPRVKVIDGTNVAAGTILADFFAFDPNDRSGVFASAGDFNNDGRADLAVGTGPGAATTVRIYNGANVVVRDPNQDVILREFQPFGAGDTAGARVAIRNIESNANADLLVASASGEPVIRTFAGTSLGTSKATPNPIQVIDPFGDPTGDFGAFVG